MDPDTIPHSHHLKTRHENSCSSLKKFIKMFLLVSVLISRNSIRSHSHFLLFLIKKIVLPVISNYFGKHKVNYIHFESISVKYSATKYLQKSWKRKKKAEIRLSMSIATLFSETLMNVANVACLLSTIGDKASFL